MAQSTQSDSDFVSPTVAPGACKKKYTKKTAANLTSKATNNKATTSKCPDKDEKVANQKKKAAEGKSKTTVKSKKDVTPETESDSTSSDQEPNAKDKKVANQKKKKAAEGKSKTTVKSKKDVTPETDSDSTSSDQETIAKSKDKKCVYHKPKKPPQGKSKKKVKSEKLVIASDSDSSSEDEERTRKAKSKTKKRSHKSKRRYIDSGNSSTESDTSTTDTDESDKVKKKKKKKKVKPNRERRSKFIHDDLKYRKKKNVSDSSAESDTEMEETDYESDESVREKKKKKGKGVKKGKEKLVKKETKRKRKVSKNDHAGTKKQKTVKDILKELPSINTRSTPALMYEAIQSMKSVQKEWVKKMGFKAFLKINFTSIPLKLCHFVLDHYDEATNTILIGEKRIKITKEKIYQVFGLPKAGTKLFSLDMVDEEHPIFDGWVKQLPEGKPNATNYMKNIQKCNEADVNFKLSFIALFMNTFGESLPMGTNKIDHVRAVVQVDDISTIDWCAYLLYCVKNAKGRWRPDNSKAYYKGPMVLLLLIYCDAIECKLQVIDRKTPLLTMWTTELLRDRQNLEVEAGGFGVGNLLLEAEKKDNENNNKRIEEYEEKFEIIINNVSREKNDLEEILHNCLSVFPEDNRTREMKMNFIDVFSTTLFSSREDTEVAPYKVEDHNQEPTSEFVGDTPVDMNSKPVEDNQERQTGAVDMNVDEQISLVAEGNIGEGTDREMAVEENVGNESGKITIEGPQQMDIGMETVDNIEDQTVGDNRCESSIVTPLPQKQNTKGISYHFSPFWTDSCIKKLDEDAFRALSNKNPVQDPVVKNFVPKKLTFENSEYPSFDLQITQLMDDAESGDKSGGKNEVGGNIEEIVPDEGKMGENVEPRDKRKVNVPDVYRSPYVNRAVVLTDKITNEQEIMAQIMFRCAAEKDQMELRFETEPGDVMFRTHFEEMRPNHEIHPFVIDCWAAVLNFEEDKLRNKRSPSRLFFNTQIMTGKLLDLKQPFVDRFRIFDDVVKSYILEVKRQVDFDLVALVFFPIYDRGHFYVLVFNISNSPEYFIIDSIKQTKKIEDIYGEMPKLVQAYFSKFLENNLRSRTSPIKSLKPKLMKMSWQTKEQTKDDGIILMRNIEKYMGEKEDKWTVDLGETNLRRSNRIAKLRTFYVAKLANHEINLKKNLNVEEATEFAKLDKKTRTKLVTEGGKARDALETLKKK